MARSAAQAGTQIVLHEASPARGVLSLLKSAGRMAVR